MSYFDNYTFNIIKKKIDEGKELSPEEKAYVSAEAAGIAEEIKAQWKTRGPGFLHALSLQLHNLAEKDLPLKTIAQPKVHEDEPTPSMAHRVFGDE